MDQVTVALHPASRIGRHHKKCPSKNNAIVRGKDRKTSRHEDLQEADFNNITRLHDLAEYKSEIHEQHRPSFNDQIDHYITTGLYTDHKSTTAPAAAECQALTEFLHGNFIDSLIDDLLKIHEILNKRHSEA